MRSIADSHKAELFECNLGFQAVQEPMDSMEEKLEKWHPTKQRLKHLELAGGGGGGSHVRRCYI